MIEGSLLIIGEGRLPEKELSGLVTETRRAALLLALTDWWPRWQSSLRTGSFA